MIKEIRSKSHSLSLSDTETEVFDLFSIYKIIKSEMQNLRQDLKFTQAELKNRTGSILRMEQKIDRLYMRLVNEKVIKVK